MEGKHLKAVSVILPAYPIYLLSCYLSSKYGKSSSSFLQSIQKAIWSGRIVTVKTRLCFLVYCHKTKIDVAIPKKKM